MGEWKREKGKNLEMKSKGKGVEGEGMSCSEIDENRVKWIKLGKFHCEKKRIVDWAEIDN